jgi:hypothetical protein
MKSFLLPHIFKRIGWFIMIPSMILGILHLIIPDLISSIQITTYGYFGNNFLTGQVKPSVRFGRISLIPNMVGLLLLLGGIMLMFSKEKKEDEYINQIRLRSFHSSVFINYVILFFCILFFHNVSFFYVMICNLYTIIIIYVFRFHYLIRNNSIEIND